MNTGSPSTMLVKCLNDPVRDMRSPPKDAYAVLMQSQCRVQQRDGREALTRPLPTPRRTYTPSYPHELQGNIIERTGGGCIRKVGKWAVWGRTRNQTWLYSPFRTSHIRNHRPTPSVPSRLASIRPYPCPHPLPSPRALVDYATVKMRVRGQRTGRFEEGRVRYYSRASGPYRSFLSARRDARLRVQIRHGGMKVSRWERRGWGARRTSVKFLALLVYGIDREDVVKEDVGCIRSHYDA